jgi:hypothetical protein
MSQLMAYLSHAVRAIEWRRTTIVLMLADFDLLKKCPGQPAYFVAQPFKKSLKGMGALG